MTCAIALEPTNAFFYYARATTYQNLQEYELAIADYDHTIMLDPTDIPSYYDRSIAYSFLHQYEAALADVNRVLELDPNSAIAYGHRGLVYMHEGLGNEEQIHSDFCQYTYLARANLDPLPEIVVLLELIHWECPANLTR
ncbi:MAG: hypothetical protein U0521_13425 [Anaerolineae bacterium]